MPLRIQGTLPVRLHPAPCDRETVGVEAKVLHQADVVGPEVVVVAGHIAQAVDDRTGLAAEAVPDAFTLAVGVPASSIW